MRVAILVGVCLAALLAGALAAEDCCDVECGYSAWSAFSPCSVSCGKGTQTRTRTIIRQAQGIHVCNETMSETQFCNDIDCPKTSVCGTRPQRDIIFVIPRTGTSYGNPLANIMLDAFRILTTADLRDNLGTDEDENFPNNRTAYVGVVYYPPGQGEPDVLANLNDSYTKVRDALTDNTQSGFRTSAGSIGPAIDSAVWELHNGLGARSDAEKIIVLFTYQGSSPDPVARCELAQRSGIRIIGVGMSTGTGFDYLNNEDPNAKQLKQLVSKPLVENYIPIQYFIREQPTNAKDYFSSYWVPEASGIIARRLMGSTAGDTCNLYGNAHITTFDGNNYDFPGYGDFYLTTPCDSTRPKDLSTPTFPNPLVSQVRILPCTTCDQTHQNPSSNLAVEPRASSGRGCARAFAFKDESFGTVEVGWHPSQPRLSIIYDGVDEHDELYSNHFVRNSGNNVLEIFAFQRLQGGFYVMISYGLGPLNDGGPFQDYLTPRQHLIELFFNHYDSGATASIRPAAQNFYSSKLVGLCGSYDNCPANDFVSPSQQITDVTATPEAKYQTMSQWRVNRDASLFTLKLGEGYNKEDWSPSFAPLQSSELADSTCTRLPDSLASLCRADVTLNKVASSADAYREMLFSGCRIWCNWGVFPNTLLTQALQTQEADNMCRDICRYSFGEEYVVTADGSDLHTRLAPGALPETDLRGHDLPNSVFYFHPAVTRGGTYTFERTVTRPDFCGDEQFDPQVSKQVNVTVACMPIPKAVAGNYSIAFYGTYEWPLITMHGSVDTSVKGSAERQFQDSLQISWKILEFEPRSGEPNMTDDGFPTIIGHDSLTPRWIPTQAGRYTVELAISDGCAVSRDQTVVHVLQRCCVPEIQAIPADPIFWQNSSTSPSRNFYPTTGREFSVTGSGNQASPLPHGNPIGPSGTPATSLTFSWQLEGRKDVVDSAYNAEINSTVNGDAIEYKVFRVVTPGGETEVPVNKSDSESVTTFDPVTTDDRLRSDKAYLRPTVDLEAVFKSNKTTQVIQNTTETMVIVRKEKLAICELELDDTTDENPKVRITSDFPASNDFGTAADQCEGFYTFNLTVNVKDYGAFCNRVRRVNLPVLCGNPPVPILSCENNVTFNYSAGSFPLAELKSEGSYDPSDIDISYLNFRWLMASTPTGSDLPIGVNNVAEVLCPSGRGEKDCEFQPDVEGEYTVRMDLSNGCKDASDFTTVTAVCGPAPSTALPTTPLTITQSDADPAIFIALFDASASSPNTDNLKFKWNVTASPLPVPEDSQEPDISDDDAEATNITFHYGGTYTVAVVVSDGCKSTPASREVTITCEGGVNLDGVSLPTTLNPLEDGTFADLELNAAAAVVTGPENRTDVYHWLYSGPGCNTPPICPIVANQIAVNKSITTGKYTFYLRVSQGCDFKEKSFDVEALCSPDVTPVVAADATLVWSLAHPYPKDYTIALTGTPLSANLTDFRWRLMTSPIGYRETSLVSSPNATFPGDFGVTSTDIVAGSYTFLLEACNTCGRCGNSTTSPFVDISCPYDFGTAVARASSSISNWKGGRFGRIEVDGLGSDLGGLDPDAPQVTFTWLFTSAPEGSTYALFTDSSENITTSEPQIDPVVNNDTYTITLETVTKTTTKTTVRYFSELKASEVNHGLPFAACFHPDLAGPYSLELTVKDTCETATASVSVTAACNAAPTVSIAVVPGDLSVSAERATPITIKAVQTTGQLPVTYSWSFTGTLAVNLTSYGRDSSVVTFMATQVGTYTGVLSYTDGCNSGTSPFSVTTTSSCTPVDRNDGGEIVTAYDYLHQDLSVAVCLSDDIKVVNDSLDLKEAGNIEGANMPSGWNSSYLYLPLVRCQATYSWKLVRYLDTIDYQAADPCLNPQFSSLAACKALSAPSESKPFVKTGGFIGVMVAVCFVVVLLVVLAVWKFKKRSS